MTRKLKDNELNIGAFFNFAALFSIGMLVQIYLKTLNASLFYISLASMLYALSRTLFQPIWGTVSDLLGKRKPFLLLSLIFTTLMIPMFSLAKTPQEVLVLRFLLGVFMSAFGPSALAHVVENRRETTTGRALSYFNASSSAGEMGGRIIAGTLTFFLPIRYIFFFLTTLSIIALYFINKVKENVEINKGIPKFKDIIIGIKGRLILWEGTNKDIMKKNGLMFVYLGSFLRQSGITGFFSLVYVYMVYQLNVSPGMSGFVSAANPFTQIFSMIVFGRLVDVIGRKTVFMIGVILSSLVPLLFALSNGIFMLLMANITLGVAFGAFLSGTTTFVSDVAPYDMKAELMGLLNMSRSLGGIVGPLIAGIIANEFGYLPMFISMSLIIVVGLISFTFSRETLRFKIQS